MDNQFIVVARDVSEAVSGINNARRRSYSRWYWVSVELGGEVYRFKCYGTWVQCAVRTGVKDGGPTDCSVKDFKAYLVKFMGGE